MALENGSTAIDEPSRVQKRFGALVVVLALPFISIVGMGGNSLHRTLRAFRDPPILPLTPFLISVSRIVGDFWYLGFAVLACIYIFWACRRRVRLLAFNAVMSLLLPAVVVLYSVTFIAQFEELQRYARAHNDLHVK